MPTPRLANLFSPALFSETQREQFQKDVRTSGPLRLLKQAHKPAHPPKSGPLLQEQI